MTKENKTGVLLMILAALFFSIMGALVKYTTKEIPFMEAVFFRSSVMAVLMTPVMIHRRIPFWGHNRLLLFIRVILGFAALCISFYIVTQIHLADASILNRTSVLFVAVLSAIILRERVSVPLIVYILCAFVGCALIIKPSLDVLNVPGLLGLASGFMAALAYICVKTLHKTDHVMTIVFWFAFVASVLSGIYCIFFGWEMPHGLLWPALIMIGMVATIAQLCMTQAYKHTEASIVSPYSFSTVVFSGLWGYLFWDEVPDEWSILGGLLIIVCGIGIMKLKKDKGETSIELDSDYSVQGEGKV